MRKRILICSLLLMLSITLSHFKSVSAAPSHGLMHGVIATGSLFGGTLANITDGLDNTTATFVPNGSITFNLSIPIKVTAYYMHTFYPNGTDIYEVRFYDVAGDLVRTMGSTHSVAGTNYVSTGQPLNNIKTIQVRSKSGTYYGTLHEFDIEGEPIDTIPPQVPTGLVASPDANAVNLKWDVVPDSDLRGYFIYRDGLKLNQSPVTTTSYQVTGLADNQQNLYRVSAIDNAGNESAQSEAVQGTSAPAQVKPTLFYTSTLTDINLWWDHVGLNYEIWNVFNGVDYKLYTQSDTTYTISGLSYSSQISVYVVSIDKYGRRIKSDLLTALTKDPLPEQKPILTFTDLKHDSFLLKWSNVGVEYQVFLDDHVYRVLSGQSLVIDGLESNTLYTAKVIAKDMYGRFVSSDDISVTTLSLPPSVPQITISDIEHDKFHAEWLPDTRAVNFQIYLNGSLVATQTNAFFDFTGLSPNTLYTVKVVANGNGTNPSESTKSVRTGYKKVPTILTAAVAPVSGQPTKRNLTYEPNDMVTAVKVYVNDELIGEYPVSEQPIELDYSTLAGSAVADIKIEPIDPEGQVYKFSSLASTTGNLDFDDFIAEFISMFGISRNAFMILALAALPITVFVILFFWTRRKAKGLVSGSGTASDPQQASTPKKPYKAWNKMSDKERLEYRSQKNFEKTGYRIKHIAKRKKTYGLLGLGGEKQYEVLTFEKNGVEYVNKYVRGRGRVYVPRDAKNQLLHVKGQLTNLQSQLFKPKQKQLPSLQQQTTSAPPIDWSMLGTLPKRKERWKPDPQPQIVPTNSHGSTRSYRSGPRRYPKK